MYAKRLGVATILAVVIFGAVYGLAASISITGVGALGGGTAGVPSPPPVTKVHFLLAANGLDVDEVYIEFGGTQVTGNVYVHLTDVNGNIISSSAQTWYDASGSMTVDVPDVRAASVYDITIVFTQA